MTISDYDLARACANTYVGAPPSWEDADQDIHAFASRIEGVDIIAFKGSVSFLDWFRDFEAVPVEATSHPKLGWVHAGFYTDVTSIWAKIRDDLGDRPYMVCGHSKGGAEAILFAALMTAEARAPQRVVTCGAPRAGFATMRDLLAPVDIRQYRHGADVVPTVPMPAPGLDWCHAREPVIIGQTTGDKFADHHIAGYLDALAAL